MRSPLTITPDELDFAGLIREGDTIGWAEATAEPVLLTRLLDRQADRCPPFRIFFALTFAGDFRADHPNVTATALGGASAGRRFFARGAGNVIPANISDVAGLIAGGRLRTDIVLLQVTGPDTAGNYNAGVGIEFLREMMAGARLVIAHVNPLLPWTDGDTLIEPGVIDILVPAPHSVLEVPARDIGPVEQAIAEHVARLVPDRATIELGIGQIPEAVTRALGQKRGLGVHSGAIGDGVADLMEAGVVDDRHKEIDEGVTVATMLMGTHRLYGFADRNPKIHVRSPRYTHDALVLGNFRRFIAINGALEVDLTGQVTPRPLAGGMSASSAGRWISCAPPTARRRGGPLSRYPRRTETARGRGSWPGSPMAW